MALLKENVRLERSIESAVSALGFCFVGCEFILSDKCWLLRVYVDTKETDENVKKGIDIDSIANISRQISMVLQTESFEKRSYTLEVSSPGINRPLFRLNDYRRFVGHPIKLRLLFAGEGSRRHYRGTLSAVSGEKIVLTSLDGEKVVVNFREIAKANLISAL